MVAKVLNYLRHNVRGNSDRAGTGLGFRRTLDLLAVRGYGERPSHMKTTVKLVDVATLKSRNLATAQGAPRRQQQDWSVEHRRRSDSGIQFRHCRCGTLGGVVCPASFYSAWRACK